jgi:hypothetical protein
MDRSRIGFRGNPMICALFAALSRPKEMNKIYGTEFMVKSLTFIWEPYYGVDTDSHAEIPKELAELIDAEKIKSYLRKSLMLDLNRLRKGHQTIEDGRIMGIVDLGVSVEIKGGNPPFM